MNKIKIENDRVILWEIDDSIEFSWKEKNEHYPVNCIKIIIKKDTELDINYNTIEDSKMDVFINVKENINANIYEHNIGNTLKIQYRYYLEKNACVENYKTSTSKGILEHTIINLNGENSSVKRVIKTVSTDKENYDTMIYHNAPHTNSEIINNGVNISNGKLDFQVSSFVPQDSIGCTVLQNNRIINLTENECIIKPNMYIDCFDVNANHSAFIGAFKPYEMFYLQSRGISYEESAKLLINGFLISNLPEFQQKDFENIMINIGGEL